MCLATFKLGPAPGSSSRPRVGDALGRRLDVEPERALDGDPAEAGMGGGEDAADDDVFRMVVFRYGAGVAIAEVGNDLQDVLHLGARQHAVQTAQDGQRQDHVLVNAALEGVADQVRNAPTGS